MLAELVRFDTTSRDGNIPLIKFVEDYLDSPRDTLPTELRTDIYLPLK